MPDQKPWLIDKGYADDEVPDSLVLHKELPSGARVTVRHDEGFWCIASFAKRKDEATVSFVVSGVKDDNLQADLERFEAELAWLYETFNGK